MKGIYLGSTKLSRRSFLHGAAAVGVAAASGSIQRKAHAQSQAVVQVWLNGVEKDQGAWLKDVAERFEATNPNIKIEYTLLDWKGARQKIITSAAGGTLPDLWMIFSSDIAGYAEQGVIRPLDDLVDQSVLLAPLAKDGSWRGKLFGVPLVSSTPVLNYRNDLVTAAGLDASTPPKTWAEMANWAEKLVVRDASENISRTGFFISTGHPYKGFDQFKTMLYSNGGRLFSADGTKSLLASKEAIETVSFFNDLLNNKKVDQPGIVQVENRDFGQGKIAMLNSAIAVRGWNKDFPDLANTKTVTFAAPVAGPSSQPGMGRVSLASNAMVMKNNTQVPEQAAAFLKYMSLDPMNITTLCAFDEAAPAIKGPEVDKFFETHPFAAEYQRLVESNGMPQPKHPAMGAMLAPGTQALDAIYLKGEDPKAALEAAAAEIDKMLERSGVAAEEPV